MCYELRESGFQGAGESCVLNVRVVIWYIVFYDECKKIVEMFMKDKIES